MKFENFRLSEICEIQIGKTPSRAQKEYWGKGYSWVSIADMKSEVISKTKEEITELAVKECGCKLIPKGTLLFSFKLSIGKISFAGESLFTNEAIAALGIKNPKKLTNKYLFYALKNIPLLGSNKAVMGFTLNKESLKLLKIPLPETLLDQIKIAQILTQAEKLIAQRKESIGLLEEYLKSTFLEIFGDPVRNEMGWEVKKLSRIVKVGTGGTPSRNRESEFYGGDINWAKTTEVNGGYIYSTEEKITKMALRESNCKVYPVGTILLAMYGQGKTRGNVGYLKIAAATNQACAAIPPSSDINQIFLFELLKRSYAYLRSLARGGNQENLNLGIVGGIDIILPSPSLQTQFAQIVEKTEALKSRYQHSLQELEQLFGSLSQRAFKGELDLSRMEVSEEAYQISDVPPVPTAPQPEKIKKERPQVAVKEDTETSIWLSNRKKGKTGKVPFTPVEGNAVLHTEFSKRDKGFHFQAFEAFLKKEGFIYEYEQVKDFLFEKLGHRNLLQYYATQEWMAQQYRPETSPEQDDFSGDGRIWLVVNNKAKQ